MSIVLPTYQRAESLQSTIASLLNQSLRNAELIVMDDGSTDNTAEVVARAGSRQRVRYVRREHLGIPRIVNEGMALASGEYVVVCHDHDAYHEQFLESLSTALDTYPSTTFAYCGVTLVGPDGVKEVASYIYNHGPIERGRSFLVDHLLPGIPCPVHGLSMVRRSALGDQFLKPEYGPVADVELWLRLSSIGDVAYVPGPLITIRQRDSSSEFYGRSLELARLTLRAKRKYLTFAPKRLQERIERGWRREINRVALATLWQALEAQQRDAVQAVRSVLQQEGTPFGSWIGRALGGAPRVFSLMLLRIARRWVHSLRALHRLRRLREA